MGARLDEVTRGMARLNEEFVLHWVPSSLRIDYWGFNSILNIALDVNFLLEPSRQGRFPRDEFNSYDQMVCA